MLGKTQKGVIYMNKMKSIFPENYEMSNDELAAAAALKMYLELTTEKEAQNSLKEVLLVTADGRAEVKSGMLAILIDKAAEKAIKVMDEVPQCSEAVARKVMKKLLMIQGHKVVDGISVGFLDFLFDCNKVFNN